MKINFVNSQDESTVESQAFVRAVTDEYGIHIEISKDPAFGEDSAVYKLLTVDKEDSGNTGRLVVNLYAGFGDEPFGEFVSSEDHEGDDYIEVIKL